MVKTGEGGRPAHHEDQPLEGERAVIHRLGANHRQASVPSRWINGVGAGFDLLLNVREEEVVLQMRVVHTIVLSPTAVVVGLGVGRVREDEAKAGEPEHADDDDNPHDALWRGAEGWGV